MESYNTVIKLAAQLAEADEKMEVKYTKAESKRQRDRINQIQKLAIAAKRDLLGKDSA
jgi:uncharacterized protein